MMNIIVVDYHRATINAISALFPDASVISARTAEQAIVRASDTPPDVVILELSLAGHSGLEFLYEFRSYTDWQQIPVIIYSSLRVDERVRASRAWQQLGITAYLYKPEASLALLKSHVDKLTGPVSS